MLAENFLGKLINHSNSLKQSKLLATLSAFRHDPAYIGRIFRPDTYTAAKFYYKAMKKIYSLSEVARRNKISKQFQTSTVDAIAHDIGYKSLDFTQDPMMKNCIAYCKQQIQKIDFVERAKQAKKPYLIDYQFDLNNKQHEAIRQIGCHPRIISAITQYLGILPVLGYAAIWYSPNEYFEQGRSQMYHIDGEDFKQVKCFIPLEEISIDSGPLTVIPAAESKQVYRVLRKNKTIKRRNQKLSDEVIYSNCNRQQGMPLLGKPGEALLVDTCSCYHYGSRPGNKPRIVLHLHYYSPFAVHIPVWGRKHKVNEALHAEADQQQQDLWRYLFGAFTF